MVGQGVGIVVAVVRVVFTAVAPVVTTAVGWVVGGNHGETLLADESLGIAEVDRVIPAVRDRTFWVKTPALFLISAFVWIHWGPKILPSGPWTSISTPSFPPFLMFPSIRRASSRSCDTGRGDLDITGAVDDRDQHEGLGIGAETVLIGTGILYLCLVTATRKTLGIEYDVLGVVILLDRDRLVPDLRCSIRGLVQDKVERGTRRKIAVNGSISGAHRPVRCRDSRGRARTRIPFPRYTSGKVR